MKRRNTYTTPVTTTGLGARLKRLALGVGSALTATALAFSLTGGTALAKGANAPQAAPITRALHAASAGTRAKAAESATVLVYLNGSDLESYAGEASEDISEMLASGIGTNANVVIETLGTSEWQDHGIASDHTQRYAIKDGKLELVDDSLGQLDTTDPQTLADFIKWGVANYPADRYILLLWDHGAGPVYGFGYDEFQPESSALTLDEMQEALEANADVHFDIIGMDCCIMSSLETCYVLEPFCDYTVLSEDFEPGIGWSYTNWMKLLEQNPNVGTEELGKLIVDDMIADVAKNPENGDATLALIDEAAVPELYNAWVKFAYANEDALLGTNYSTETEWRARPMSTSKPGGHGHGFEGGQGFGAFDDYGYDSYGYDDYGYGYDSMGSTEDWEFLDELMNYWDLDDSYVTMTDYFVTDILQVASSVESDEATALETALDRAIVHYNATEGEEGMSGLGITLPYGDAEFYDELVDVFTACEMDSSYLDWLESFVDAEGAENHYDYEDLSDLYDESGEYDDGSYDPWYGDGADVYGYEDDWYGSDDWYGYGVRDDNVSAGQNSYSGSNGTSGRYDDISDEELLQLFYDRFFAA